MAITGRSQSTSSQTLPFPKQSGQIATSIADTLTGLLGNYNSDPTGGGAADFNKHYENVGGPAAEFTDYQKGDFFSPQRFAEEQNNIWGEQGQRTAYLQDQARNQMGPGRAPDGELNQLLAGYQNAGRAIGQQGMIQHASQFKPQAAQYDLASAGTQTNIESLRAGDDQNRRSQGLQARGQDLDFNKALFALLGSNSGIFSPLTNSQSTESHGVINQQARAGTGGLNIWSPNYDEG